MDTPPTPATELAGHAWAAGEQRHIVDQLIDERATSLSKNPLWPILRPLLLSTFHYRKAVRMADDIAGLSGYDAFKYLSRLLSLDLTQRGVEKLPKAGAFILAPSHPTGIADGIAIFDALLPHRPDMAIFANRDALRVTPGFIDLIIPVEWRQGEKTHSKRRDTLVTTSKAFADGKVVVLFPSGRIAYWNEGKLTERPWQTSVISLAQRFDVPVVPANITSRNSGLFYFVSKYSTDLRDMTVFHELLNKKGKPFRITYGEPIAPEQLTGDPVELTARLQEYAVHTLARDPDAKFV
ncbi:MAG TPA: 1-acyl-sn-glycerol-3-phosphate acyltransferase [Rhizobiaceae bacterium]|nr:1-acyl-sn-glycerol-3-phosphate acyltransferase [Rhizobiaceae bacterium]